MTNKRGQWEEFHIILQLVVKKVDCVKTVVVHALWIGGDSQQV